MFFLSTGLNWYYLGMRGKSMFEYQVRQIFKLKCRVGVKNCDGCNVLEISQTKT